MPASKTVIKAVSEFKRHLEAGLQAMSESHRKLILEKKRRSVRASINMDKVCHACRAGDAPWDYGIETKCGIIWIEIHPACPREVDEIIDKKQRHCELLNRCVPQCPPPAGFVWLPSGSNTVLKTSPEYKRLAKAGIKLASVPYSLS